jgi:hypothetical protein
MKSRCCVYGWWLSSVLVLCGAADVSDAHAIQPDDCLDASKTAYPPLDSPPIARATHATDVSTAPVGAGCFDETISATWITVASVIRTTDDSSTIVERFGAISELRSVRYWSTADQQWRRLISSASAIAGGKLAQPRADYSVAELSGDKDLYYRVTDTRSGRATLYRLRLLRSQLGRVVVQTSNVEAIRQWGFTLYASGGLDTLYFLNERSPGVWSYYSITRVAPASLLAEGHEKSLINRAVALYRHYMRLPTDAEPPSAP